MMDALREIEEISKELKVSFSLYGQQSGSSVPMPYLGLRIKVFYVFQPGDLDSMCLYYMHFVNEYMKGNYPAKLEQTALLASLKLISEHGCYLKNKSNLPKFTPSRIPISIYTRLRTSQDVGG